MKFALLLLALAACPKSDQKKTVEPSHPSGATEDGGRQLLPASDAGVALAPSPPLPEVPFGLPPAPTGVLDAVTPDQVALGLLLFTDPAISAPGSNVTCAGCHDLAHRLNGVPRRDHPRDPQTPPQLENLAWNPRAIAALPAHVEKEMGLDLASAAAAVAAVPGYQPHLARIGGTPEQAVTKALTGFLLTRYDGNSPWDNQERSPFVKNAVQDGYRLFIGKAKCGTCHTPPLYTDGRTHETGFGPQPTRSLRGVAKRTEWFSDGSAHTLDEAVTYYTVDHPKTELAKIGLTPAERTDLLAFLDSLTGELPRP